MNHFIQVTRSKEAIFIISTMVLTLSVALLSAHFDWGYPSAFGLATGMFAAIAAFAFWANDVFLKRLLLFGIVAGFTELLADAWLVYGIDSLVYPPAEAKIWASPNYMPFAWAVVLIQVGYLGWLYAQSHPMLPAMGISFLIGMLFIPTFETCAKFADWWFYKPSSPMLLNTPIYIIIGEGLIALVLPLIYNKEMKETYLFSGTAGILQGLWIFASYFLVYQIVGLVLQTR